MTAIWNSTNVTPSGTGRIPKDVSSGGAPSHVTEQQLADLGVTVGQSVQALGTISTNTTITISNGGYVTATIGGALTFTFSSAPAGGCIWNLVLTNGGSAIVTWPGSVSWTGGTAPTLRTSGVDIIRFHSADGGTTWVGELAYDEQNIDASSITSGTLDAARLPAATTSAQGAVELATQAEVDAGSDTSRAMTPATNRSQTPPYVTRGASADHTLVLSDANVDQWFDSSSNRVLNLVANSSVAFATGTKIPIIRLGSGTVTIDAPTGVTLNGVDGGSCTINTRYQGALLTKTGTDAWVVSGDVSAVA